MDHKKEIIAERKREREWEKGKSVLLLQCIAIWSESSMVLMVTIF